jgi:phosphoglycolate phosphatase
MIGHAVFDLDGTLVDSVPVMTDILNAMLAERGAPRRLSREEVAPHATAGGLAMVEALLGELWGEPVQALAAFRARYAARPTPPDSLYPGVRDMLASLTDRGVGLALFSNKSRRLCEKVLGELDIASRFSAIVGTSPDVPLKPDPAGLDLALARAGGARASCCYVGDSAPDRALALAAGVPLVLAAWGYGEADADWTGVGVARSPAEAPGLVLAALAGRVAAR